MADILEFLTERLNEDENAARFAPPAWDRNYITLVRVLAEVEAKRRILERWRDLAYEVEQAESRGDYEAAPVATAFAYEQVCATLASVYQDHPQYRPDWSIDA